MSDELQKLAERMKGFEATLAELEKRVCGLETPGEPEHFINRRTRFQENGNWARHYSTVRMATTTFLISLSLGILSFKWTPPEKPDPYFVALAGAVWIAAVALFLGFTGHTFSETARAREKSKKLPDGNSAERKKFCPRWELASWVVVIITFLYGAVLIALADVSLWPPVSFSKILNEPEPILHSIPGLIIITAVVACTVTLVRNDIP